MSVTEALVKKGVEVAVVELKDWVLNTILDREAALVTQEALAEAGVRVLTGHTVQRILGRPDDDSSVGGVALASGEELPCDIVVVAIGVVPRTELATGTPVQVNRGIVVDRRMTTSVPNVYACGDVAEGYDFVYETDRLTPIWPNAYLGGRVAGYNMAGKRTQYPGGTAANSLKYFGYPLVSAGMVNPQDGCEVLAFTRDQVYRKVVLRDDHIVGLLFAGDIQKAGVVFGLMREKVNVRPFKDALVRDDFGLAFLPEGQRWAKLGRPPALKALREESARADLPIGE